jgi:hypothetical protein
MQDKEKAKNDFFIESSIPSSKTPSCTLAGRLRPQRARVFLVELLNLPPLPTPPRLDLPAFKRFARRLPEFCFDGVPPLAVRLEVEYVWRQPTTLDREIALLEALKVILSCYPGKSEAEATTWANISTAIWHGQKFADLLRICPNSDCPAPYFVAEKRSQKYCSKTCAAPAQREQKRIWWSDKGPAWRAKRKSKAARRSKKSQRKGEK